MTLIKSQNNNVFKRKHDGVLFGNEINLGLDFSTGVERKDLAEYYDEIRNPELPIPPPLSPYAVEIPLEYRLPFRNGVFKLNAFEVPLDDYQDTKVVNVAYFEWVEFRAELDTKDASGNFVYQALKDSLMDLWDYVAEQVNIGNVIIL
jgi:hypothetical protein